MPTYEVNEFSITKGQNTFLIKVPSKSVYFGACTTAAATQEKNVLISGLENIVVGTQINVTFTNAQTYNGKPSLQINDLAAVIVNNGFQNMWQAGETVNFVFDGTYWLYVGSSVASTTKYGITKLVNSVTNDANSAITPAAVSDLSETLQALINRVMVGATSSAAGVAGRVPAPAKGYQNKYLKGDGTWKSLNDDTTFTALSTLANNLSSSSAKKIHLTTDDTTLAAIYDKINALESGEAATFIAESSAFNILSDEKRSNKVYGVISKRSSSEYHYLLQLNSNTFIVAMSTGLTRTIVENTYSEVNVTGQIGTINNSITSINTALDSKVDTSAIKNNHSTTDAGYVLDARQGKTLSDMIGTHVVGQKITKAITGGTNTVTINLEDGCCCFLIASMPGISRCWVGIVYTASDGTVNFNQINNTTSITAANVVKNNANVANKLKFTFSYSSDSSFNLLAIPFRGSIIPTF